MESIFKLVKAAPLTELVRSREAYIYFNRAIKIIGWSAPKQGKLRYLYLSYTILTFILFIFYMPLGLALTYVKDFSSFTPGEFLTSLQVAINACGSSVKSTITYISLWRLSQTDQLLDKLDGRIRNDKDRQKIHDVVARCNYAFMVYTFTYSGYATSTFLSYVLSGRPPWSIYNPFLDWHLGTGSLWLQSILEYIFMSAVCLQDMLADIYPLIYTIMFRAHYDLLKDHVRSLRTDPDKTEEENYQELVDCIMDHKTILNCCGFLRPIISRTILVQFLLIGCVLGLTLINVFFFSTFWRACASVMFVFAVLLQTFPFCYICNLLIDDCAELSNTIFQSNWTNADSRYKATLLQFLQHVQQPIIFIAGGILPITMNSNISVAKFAFSIITIVRQMNLAERFQ